MSPGELVQVSYEVFEKDEKRELILRVHSAMR